MRIDYTAPQHVRDVIAGLGRSEDVKFSPNNRRLALAAYKKNKIAVFDISIDVSSDGTQTALTGAAEIFSSYFKEPHGLDFIDDETILVVNRTGDALIFKLPPGETASNRYELEPVKVISSGDGLNAPGSVSVSKKDRNLYEALICNNDGNNITRHLLDSTAGCSVKNSEVLLQKGLDIPDGICVSTERQWIAVSNHKMHSVYLYENTQSLNAGSDPDGILRRVYFPHGLRFTADDGFILVADAGAPYVHIYAKNGPSWRGVRDPVISFRVMSEEVFLRGRYNPMEGGPKGVDINNAMTVLVTTNECQTLAFFDLAKILEGASSQASSSSKSTLKSRHRTEERARDDPDAYAFKYELDVQLDILDRLNTVRAEGEAELAKLTNSTSWRITAPLRGAVSALRNLVHPRR